MSDEKSGSCRNQVVFCLLGFVLLTKISLILAAAQDILSKSFIPTGVFLLASSGPEFLVALVLPYFLHIFPIWLQFSIICSFTSGGLITIALAEEVHIRLTGVCFASMGYGVAELTFTSLSAFFEETAINWFSMGTGIGFVAGPLFYAGMTTLACLSPKITLLVTSALPLLYLTSYPTLAKKHKDMRTTVASHKNVQYSPLNSQMTELHLSCRDKVEVVWKTAPLVMFFLQSYALEFLIMQAIVTTIAFPNAPFDPRNHYVYYTLCFTAGEFVGRSYVSIAGVISPGRDFLVRNTWIFTVFLAFIAVFSLLASWYRFLTSIWVVLLLIVLVGAVAGAVFVNTLAVAGEGMDIARKAFSRAFVDVGLSFGILLAGLVGMYLEPQLRVHCVSIADDTKYCFTRSLHGWNATESCLL